MGGRALPLLLLLAAAAALLPGAARAGRLGREEGHSSALHRGVPWHEQHALLWREPADGPASHGRVCH